jgi:hypothetical protein
MGLDSKKIFSSLLIIGWGVIMGIIIFSFILPINLDENQVNTTINNSTVNNSTANNNTPVETIIIKNNSIDIIRNDSVEEITRPNNKEPLDLRNIMGGVRDPDIIILSE